MIWSLSAMLIAVFIVPVVSFPQTTTILHRLNIWWDILRMACISSASPSSRNGESCTAADRHISQFVDLPAVPLYFGLSFFCRTADISKCLFQYDHLLSWPDRFPLPGVFQKETPTKHSALWMSCGHLDSFLLFSDVCQTSGYCGSLFSASSPASSAMRTRSLPSL